MLSGQEELGGEGGTEEARGKSGTQVRDETATVELARMEMNPNREGLAGIEKGSWE
jgi:hypothetical protein